MWCSVLEYSTINSNFCVLVMINMQLYKAKLFYCGDMSINLKSMVFLWMCWSWFWKSLQEIQWYVLFMLDWKQKNWKTSYPWIYEDKMTQCSINAIMPTDDALITAIRCHFQSFDHDASGKYFDFLQSNDLHKAWYILSSDIKKIPLEDYSGYLFLCWCNGNSDGNAGHMFISVSKFITVCSDCASYKRNKQ